MRPDLLGVRTTEEGAPAIIVPTSGMTRNTFEKKMNQGKLKPHVHIGFDGGWFYVPPGKDNDERMYLTEEEVKAVRYAENKTKTIGMLIKNNNVNNHGRTVFIPMHPDVFEELKTAYMTRKKPSKRGRSGDKKRTAKKKQKPLSAPRPVVQVTLPEPSQSPSIFEFLPATLVQQIDEKVSKEMWEMMVDECDSADSPTFVLKIFKLWMEVIRKVDHLEFFHNVSDEIAQEEQFPMALCMLCGFLTIRDFFGNVEHQNPELVPEWAKADYPSVSEHFFYGKIHQTINPECKKIETVEDWITALQVAAIPPNQGSKLDMRCSMVTLLGVYLAFTMCVSL